MVDVWKSSCDSDEPGSNRTNVVDDIGNDSNNYEGVKRVWKKVGGNGGLERVLWCSLWSRPMKAKEIPAALHYVPNNS